MHGHGQCPRCGGGSLEYLTTHSHCWECNYFPEENPELDRWRELEFRMPGIAVQRRREESWHLRGLHFGIGLEAPA